MFTATNKASILQAPQQAILKTTEKTKNKCKKAASHLQIFFMLKLSLHSNKVSFPVLSESPEGRAAGLHNACMTLCGVGYCLFSDSISPPGEPGRGTAYVPPITMPSEMHIQNPAARHNLPNHTE